MEQYTTQHKIVQKQHLIQAHRNPNDTLTLTEKQSLEGLDLV